ncbi:MAG TPA: class D beta-lactamase [Pseudorhodoplanes sp.]|jgi:beta-lactamase class D|nr:class D beta-lactamase [Pseudorhodoplanes sp.]
MIDRRRLLQGVAAAAALSACPAPAQTQIELKPELGQFFHEANTQGTFAALDLKTDRLVMTDETRTRRGELPASTFKVPHALIALETGVVADVDNEVIRWDGITRSIPEWNGDHTLRSAMKYSVVPVFQQIARRIGEERMKKYVDDFQYGNRDIGGAPIDRFWLEGNLRITPLDQIRFFRRLYEDDLPVSARSLDLVKDIVPVEQADGATIHAKTGAVGRDGKLILGWLAGYAVKGQDVTVFAMNMDLHSGKDLALRMPAVKSALGKIGAI